MTDKAYFLAFDLGATSGRAILGALSTDGVITVKELSRFPNSMLRLHGSLYWDVYQLYEHIIEGLRRAAAERVEIRSVAIDTWGVDFGIITADDTIASLPRTYRDGSVNGAADRYFKSVMPATDLYAKAGIQHIDYNTLFRLNDLRDRLEAMPGSRIAMLPDLLAWMLTGKLVTEYTIASSGALMSPYSRELDPDLLASVGLSIDRFGRSVQPGTVVGRLTAEIAAETGLDRLPVIAVGGHDTASAIAAIPARDENFAYLSSGTWSLMGFESSEPVINPIAEQYNLTNEGGVEGTVRVLKNITGMWIVEQCLRSWKRCGHDYTYPRMVEMAEKAPAFTAFIDTDAPCFVCPDDMPAAIVDYCLRTGQTAPATHGEILRTVFESLAFKYRWCLDAYRRVSPHPLDRLHIIGGGSRNDLANRFAANATGLPVIAGPAEATSLGNLLLQARTLGIVGSLAEIRQITARSVATTEYAPADTDLWNNAYARFLKAVGL